MLSRLVINALRHESAAAAGIKKANYKAVNGLFMPSEIAKSMRTTGPVRIQDHDYLCVFESTPKPEISGPLAIEMRLLPIEEQEWIKQELHKIELEDTSEVEIGKCLHVAKEFDEFLAAKFPTIKRYGLEGSETILLWFDTIIKEIENTHLVIGMTHRGRNNLLVCLLGLQAEIMFGKMSGIPEFPFDDEHERIIGDVLSHLSISADLGTKNRVSLLPNPSHLDAINPAAMGKARSKAESGNNVLCIQCHGDGSLIGQGHNHEILNMHSIPGFSVDGSLHFCCDNNVAFTASGAISRSAARPGDCALPYGIPVISVSGSSPRHVIQAAKLAVRFRAKFCKDVMTELVAWRKYGHNELDEPRLTNPLLYKHADNAKPIPNAFCENLTKEQNLVISNFVKEEKAKWLKSYENVIDGSYVAPKLGRQSGAWAKVNRANSNSNELWDTGVDYDQLRWILAKSVETPDHFMIHQQLTRHVKQRLEMAGSGKKADWGAAEAMAIGSLLQQDFNVRICGQEVGRATFAHRHAILTDQNTEENIIPFNALGNFHPINAPLTEQAVVAFEWGYAADHPNNLVLWEAQFGDFWNQAEVSVDTLVTCGEFKWGLQSSILMLLPHGYDGAGPDHSSSRIERLLQMTDSYEENIDPDNINFQILWPSTAAQYFHLLRRQMVRDYRKPGAVVMPKGLLRLSDACSNLSMMAPGTHFQRIIDDENIAKKYVEKIIFTSGRHYYSLVDERKKRGLNDKVALVRIEELCPFPSKDVQDVIKSYTNVSEVMYSQEEPRNCGAWSFVRPRLEYISGMDVTYSGRPEMPTSATGNGIHHKRQVIEMFNQAFA